MSELYNDALDNVFRQGIEGKSMEPPASVWEGIRATALENQLIVAKNSAMMFKGIAGVLTVLLGTAVFFIWKQSDDITTLRQQKQQVVARVVDSAQRSVVSGKQLNGNKQWAADNRQRTVTAETASNLENRTSGIFGESEQVFVSQNKPEKTEASLAKIDKSEKVSKGLNESEQVFVSQNKSEKIEASLAKIDKSEKVSKGLNGSEQVLISQNKPEKIEASLAKSERVVTDVENLTPNIERPTTATAAANVKTQISNVQYPTSNIQPLTSYIESNALTPAVAEVNYVAPPASAAVRKPNSQFDLAWLNKVSIAGYQGYEDTRKIITRDEVAAFDFGDQRLQDNTVLGVRLGIDLGKRLSLQTGFETTRLRFEQEDMAQGKEREIKLEKEDGKDKYVLRTVSGKVEIPQKLVPQSNNNPGQGNPGQGNPPGQGGQNNNRTLKVKHTGYQTTDVVRIPVALRYDFLQKRWNKYSLNLYGMAGVTYSAMYAQSAQVSLSVEGSSEQIITLNDFQNKKNTLSIQAAVGAEVGYGYHLRMFVEPNELQGITSIVKDLPLRTYLGANGLKMGLKWRVGK